MKPASALLLTLILVTCCARAVLAEGPAEAGNPPFTAWTVEAAEPGIILLLVHGFGLHKHAFDSFAKRMQREGIASYAVDIRGFGDWQDASKESQELRFDQSLVDIGSALLCIRKIHPGVPVVILGESMGGAFALQATALYPQFVDGLIASVPSRDFFGKPKAVAKALVQSLNPTAPYDLSASLVHKATRDSELQTRWKQDSHARLTVSPKELVKFELFMRKTQSLAGRIKNKPVLMLHGTRDRLAKQRGTIGLFNQLATPDKNLVMVGCAEHLILEYGQFDEHTFNVVLDWLKQHYPPCSKSSNSVSSKVRSVRGGGRSSHVEQRFRTAKSLSAIIGMTSAVPMQTHRNDYGGGYISNSG